MHGKAHVQVKTNLRVIGLGDGKFTWFNTSNGYVATERYDTSAEAQKAIDEKLKHERL